MIEKESVGRVVEDSVSTLYTMFFNMVIFSETVKVMMVITRKTKSENFKLVGGKWRWARWENENRDVAWGDGCVM